MGRLCHLVMTGHVSSLGALPHSSGQTDTDTGTVTSFSPLLALVCVCVCLYVCVCDGLWFVWTLLNMPVFPFLHLCVIPFCCLCVSVQYVCSCLSAVRQCNSGGLSWSHTDSCELSLRIHTDYRGQLLTIHSPSL